MRLVAAVVSLKELPASNSEFKPLVESGVRNVEGHLIVLQADGHRLPQV